MKTINIFIVVLASSLVGCSTNPLADAFIKASAIQYRHDIGEYWQTPIETAIRGLGDCEDQAFYLYNLLDNQKDFKVRVVFGILDIRQFGGMHAWVEVRTDGIYYILDPTISTMVPKSLVSKFNYFEVVGVKRHYPVVQEYKKRSGLSGFNKFYEDPKDAEKKVRIIIRDNTGKIKHVISTGSDTLKFRTFPQNKPFPLGD